MTIELKKGYIIDSYYDKQTRSYITTIKDNEGNQIGDALYSGNMTDRNTDVQYFKEIFYNPERWEEFKSNSYDSTEDELNDRVFIDNEILVDESLENKIKDTKKKTRKTKLPALSTLSPIMPDAAAGIDTFNSGVGLSEEYLDRDELINRISKLGFKYKFDKYTDKQLYKIYQERLRYLENKRKAKIEKEKQQRYANRFIDKLEQVEYDEDSDTYSDGNYYKNGIEFESENAANEYFGEAMENKVYLNDMHKAWNLEEDITTKKSLNENLNNDKKFRTITEGLKYFDKKAFDEKCEVTELELLYEGIKNSLDSEDIKKLGSFINKASNADEITTYIKGLLSEDLDSDNFDVYTLAENILNYASDKWNVWNTDIYDINRDDNNISFYVKGDWKHDHWAFDNAVKEYLETNYPNISFKTSEYELDEGENDSDYYPGVHTLKLSFKDESLTEARKPKYVDSLFGKHVKDAMDSGELTYDNIKEWDRKYNGGTDPIPPFNTRELMNFYYMRPDYFNESLNESFDGSVEDINVEEIIPQQKDYDRAEGLKWQGHSFKGNGEPYGSEASKMAKLIKDPIKLVRRAKAVVATYGSDEGHFSNTGYYHHVDPDIDSDVWGPFKRRLKEFGFTGDQISSIGNFKRLVTESLDDIVKDAIEYYRENAFGYSSLKNYVETDFAHYPKDKQDEIYKKMRKVLNESLNESYYVRDWWGQVDENPYEVAAKYNLSIDSIRREFDSTLYEFKGDIEDIERAKGDGYFYESEIVEVKSDFEILRELVESLEKAGFILDESASNKGLTNTRGQDWHLQVINPEMHYPTSETEGEDLSEEDAYRLFMDDLKEVVMVLDEIENKYPYISITFNFGPNKYNIVTGGIDMRMLNGKQY